MLWQRVVTAVLLLLVLLPALFYPSPEPFCLVALVFIAAAAWEWARLTAAGPALALACGVLAAALCGAAWQAGWLARPLPGLWMAAALLWVLGGGWLLYGGQAALGGVPRALRLVLGLGVLCTAWLAVAQSRMAGINYLLSVMALVWVADIGAYFAGRRWGGRWIRRKLAPGISPGKSWEGVAGGMLGVVLLALLWRWADTRFAVDSPSLFTGLDQALHGLAWPVVLGLTALSVVGDLIESLLKRLAGAKDSSRLLPGHGGVLDRLDALLPTLPVALLFHGL